MSDAPRTDETAKVLPAMLRTTAGEIERHGGPPPHRANTCRIAADQLERYSAGTWLDEIETVIAREGLTALLGMWASARETFGETVPDIEHADRIRQLIARLA